MRKTIGLLAVLLALTACTPQTQLLMALIPDGTVSMMLSHLEGVSDVNRQRLADFEQRRDWAGLARFAEENIALDKTNAGWWTVAGYAYSRLERYPRAIECYAETVRLAPDDITGWHLLAQAYRSAGQPERAVQTLLNALNVRQDSPVTFYLLGESYSDIGRFQPALDAYQRALKMNGEFAQAWFGMGRLYARQGRYAEASDIVKVLEKLDPGLAAGLLKLLPQSK
jgi:tetratricopeptide (TPR) repeat protein